MTVETDFRALLAADASVAALVGTRIAQNGAPQGADLPLVVFTSSTTHDLGLDNTILATGVTLQVQCWALTAAAADAVADAVQTAVFGAGYVVTDRASGFDPELELDATMLTVDWWA
jgi:hypothetical protein